LVVGLDAADVVRSAGEEILHELLQCQLELSGRSHWSLLGRSIDVSKELLDESALAGLHAVDQVHEESVFGLFQESHDVVGHITSVMFQTERVVADASVLSRFVGLVVRMSLERAAKNKRKGEEEKECLEWNV
jgi:hypothetical protein